MRLFLLVLLLALQLPAQASQIVVGIRSNSLLAWDFWEKAPQKLTHRLLLHNKAAQPATIEIRRWRSTDATLRGPGYLGKVLFRGKLQPGQLVQLPYPKATSGGEYLEFYENGQRVGLLENNGRQPAAAILQTGFRFYTNSGANAGSLPYWLGLESLDAGASHLAFFRPRGYDEEYQLVKILVQADTAARPPSNLDSLRTTDPAILRLDNRTPQAQAARPAVPATAALTLLTLETQFVSDSYYYDEQKVKHLRKETGGGARYFIPVLAQSPAE